MMELKRNAKNLSGSLRGIASGVFIIKLSLGIVVILVVITVIAVFTLIAMVTRVAGHVIGAEYLFTINAFPIT